VKARLHFRVAAPVTIERQQLAREILVNRAIALARLRLHADAGGAHHVIDHRANDPARNVIVAIHVASLGAQSCGALAHDAIGPQAIAEESPHAARLGCFVGARLDPLQLLVAMARIQALQARSRREPAYQAINGIEDRTEFLCVGHVGVRSMGGRTGSTAARLVIAEARAGERHATDRGHAGILRLQPRHFAPPESQAAPDLGEVGHHQATILAARTCQADLLAGERIGFGIQVLLDFRLGFGKRGHSAAR
jgi:hypothetical protein